MQNKYLDTILEDPSLSLNDDVKNAAQKIRLLALDVDGVMTDGSLYYSKDGLCMKCFSVIDGFGIRLAQEAQISIVVITAMDTPIVEKRLNVLGIKDYYPGVEDKHTHLNALRQQKNLQWEQIAYMGDDWVDLHPMSLVGLPIAVANAASEVKNIAKYITKKSGGSGAIREAIDILITCQGKKKELIHSWLETR